MEYFVLEHRHPMFGYVNGTVIYRPSISPKYVHELHQIPDDLEVEVCLNRDVRQLKLDFFSAGEAFFASEEFVEILTTNDASVVARPAVVTFGNGVLTGKKYFFVGAVERVHCFDFDRSEYSGKALHLEMRSEGKSRRVNTIQQVVLDEQSCLDRGYFFVDPDVAIMNPVVSGAVVDQARLKKLVIVPVALSKWNSNVQRGDLPRRY
jgi:hypothetical protein